jgi:hypothetical protein
MLELGSSGSVRGVLSNEHPYREPRPIPEVAPLTNKSPPHFGDSTTSAYENNGPAWAIVHRARCTRGLPAYCREMPTLPERSTNFCTLPVAVFGSSSTKLIHCGVLK